MGNKPVMYEWPQSQKCMECPHGEFVMSDRLDNSNYLCMVGCDENDGVYCPKSPPRNAIESVEVADPKINVSDKFECTLYITLPNGKVCDIDVESISKTKHWLQGEE